MPMIHHTTIRTLVQDTYTPAALQQIADVLNQHGTFDFPALANGLFPAATGDSATAYTGYANIWVRDNVYIAFTHYALGKTAIASRNATTLMQYFIKHKQRFEQVIAHEADPQEPMNRPHIRFNGHLLEEIDQKWAHAQNDALGYFLWLYCTLVEDGMIVPTSPALEVLALVPHYFATIRYWEDEDSGHWEEARKVEASSIGAALAGLQKLRQLLTNSAQHSLIFPQQQLFHLPLVDALIQHGTQALQRILPWECIQPPPQERRYDAALLFLIYPLEVVTQSDMIDQILSDVIGNLQGDYGIRRYLGDSFWAPDYKEKLSPETRTMDVSDDMSWRDNLLEAGGEAQWCIFDPIMSVIYGRKYLRDRQPHDLAQQIHYFNRSLGQLTSADCPFGALKCPELYCAEHGQYVPNDSTPLLWTQANLHLAFLAMTKSVR